MWNRALQRIGSTTRVSDENDDSEEAYACDTNYDDLLRELLEGRIWPWALREAPLTAIDSQLVTHDGDGAQVNFNIPAAYVDSQQVEVVHIDNAGTETTLDPDGDYTFSEDGEYVVLDDVPAADEDVRITVTTSRVGWEHVYGLPADCVTPVLVLEAEMRRSVYPVANRIPFEVMANDGGDGLVLCCDSAEEDIEALQYVADLDNVAMMPRKFVDALVARLAMELATAIKKDNRLRREIEEEDFEPALSEASANAQRIGHDRETMTPSLVERG